MSTVRRWYVYLVCIASLQAVAWAVISLGRDLLIVDWFSAEAAAIQIALMVIGLPIYLAHWLWAQRLARRDPDERGSAVRCLYLYAAMASFLGAALSNAITLIDVLLRALVLPGGTGLLGGLAPRNRADTALVAVVVLGLLWLYHHRVARADGRVIPEAGLNSTIRRWYLYGLSAAGLAMLSVAASGLLRWLLFQLDGGRPGLSVGPRLHEIARLAVGLALWLVFWGQAQRRFARDEGGEQASVLRKVYLYAAVFIGVQGVVTTTAFVLADLFERALRTTGSGGEGDIRTAISVAVPMAVLWAYHAWTPRRDVAAAGEAHGQVRVRQTYRYLVAGIGLAALVVGLGGLVGFLIRSLERSTLRPSGAEAVAWFCALVVVGLPVWLIPWAQGQRAAAAPGDSRDQEAGSLPRRIYLYFFLFAATMTVLSSGVYVVSQLVELALGARTALGLAALGQAAGYSAIAIGVWLYHGAILRTDDRVRHVGQAERLGAFRVAVADAGDGRLGGSLAAALRHELPGIALVQLPLTPEAEAALGPCPPLSETVSALAKAHVIVGPWTMALAGPSGPGEEIARAIVASPAVKLPVVTPAEGWQWIGLRPLAQDLLVRHAVRAVKLLLAGR